MKTKVVALIASGLLGAGIWGYSQQVGPQNMSGCPWMTQAQVQHMQNRPMMAWYMHMGQTQFYPDSPMGIAALQNQLGLSADQIKQLTAIQEKSNTDAKALLTDEQRTKLGAVTKGRKTMSMDHCWTLMNQ
jgi:hypothetical protein